MIVSDQRPAAAEFSASGRSVGFTDYWTSSRRAEGMVGWYRFTVALPSTTARVPYAFLIPNFSGSATVYWDNNLIGRSVPLSGVGVPLVSGPLLLTVPSDYTAGGHHEVLLRYEGNPGHINYVRAPMVGPLDAVQPIFVRKRITVVYLPVALGGLSIVFALVFFATYHGDPSARGIGWLTAGLIASAVSVLGLYLSVPEPLQEWLSRLRPMAFHYSFLFFWLAVRHMRQLHSWVPMAAGVAIYCLFSAAILSVDLVNAYQVATLWTLVSYTLGLYLLVQVIRLSIGPPRRLLPLLPLILVPINMIHDGIGIGNGGEFWADQLLSIYNPPVLALALMLVMVARAKLHLTNMLTMNRELEDRVEQKHAELEANYQRVAAAERRGAVLSERERMVRDMHDGLGSQLVSTLAMVESGRYSASEVEEALRDSLDDLRMMVHSLDQKESYLTDLLAMIRERVEPRVTRQGLRFKWQVDDDPDVQPLAPETAGHVLRIVQESLTNIIKHAGASTIAITTGTQGKRAYLMIADDGCGFDTNMSAAGSKGRGLHHMQERAAQLGGQLEIRSQPADKGTRITLWLPPGDEQ